MTTKKELKQSVKHKIECKSCKKVFIKEFRRSPVAYVEETQCLHCGTRHKIGVEGYVHEQLSEFKYHFSKLEAEVILNYAKYQGTWHNRSMGFEDALHDILMTANRTLGEIDERLSIKI